MNKTQRLLTLIASILLTEMSMKYIGHYGEKKTKDSIDGLWSSLKEIINMDDSE